MAANRWNERFLASTRGQVVALLRRGQRTVEELARALGLTDNAVRAHLAALERDGLVVQTGLRRGVGKPAYTYALTPDAERFFPKAYGALLGLTLDVLAERLSPAARDDLLREVGHRLAAGQTAPTGDLPARVEAAAELLGELGGLAEVERQNGCLAIQGRSCPLAAAVTGHPATCLLAETLLSDVIGAPVRQVCDPEIPRCRFEIACAPAGNGTDPPAS
jgi:predicted ArsR family transcriptional regulator